MSEFLFVTLDAGGNVPPALAMGQELQNRGHSVRVLGHEALRSQVAGAGLQFRAYRNAPPWDSTAEKGALETIRTLTSTITHAGIGNDLLEEVRHEPADVVVIDCMLLNALDAAGRAGLRHVALFHTFYEYFDGPWRRGPLGIVSRLKGLGPRRLWRTADLSLVCTDRELDPAGHRDDGPVWTGPIQPAYEPAITGPRPRVLASLSSTSFPGMGEVLQNIINAAEGLDLDLVVTTGPALDPNHLSGGSNVTIKQYVPHDELLPACSAVIGHGGHSTAFKALGHDLPMLILPMHPLLDQPMLGKAISAAGAGIALKRSADPEHIRAALRELLDEPSHREAAARVGARVRAAQGVATAAGHVEALVAHQR